MGRKKHGAQRYRDSGEADYADEEEGGIMQSSSDEEIELHSVNKTQKKRGRMRRRIRNAAEEPKLRSVCWRWFLFIVIMGLMITMLVQLYSSYGEFITDQIFPPRVSSGGLVCPNGTVTSDYQLEFGRFESTTEDNNDSGWMWLNVTKPKDTLEFALLADASAPTATRWADDDTLLVWSPNANACVKVLIFSV